MKITMPGAAQAALSQVMPKGTAAPLPLSVPKAVIGTPRMEAAGSVDRLLADVKAELGRIGDDVRRTAEDALSQARASGDVSAEVKASADKLLAEFHTLSGAQQKLEGKLEALETRNLDLEQAVAEGGRGRASAAMTVGQEVATDDSLRAYVTGGLQGNLVLRPKNAITTATGSAGGLIWPTEERGAIGLPRQRLPVRALLMQATTDSNMVRYARQTKRENGAAMTAEGAAAPVSSYGWSQADAPVRKITHVTHISDEALADAGQLQAEIDGELRYGLDLEEEAQILAGDGAGQNLTGLITVATAYAAPEGLPDETRIDRLRLGLLQVALANFAANGITLHPIDWAAIELLKDAQGRYIFGNPNEQATPRLWGLDVIPTLSHSAGEWMCGNFQMAATLYDRQEHEVLISSEHGTNFIDGMKTMKGSKRLALANKRPAALVTGGFTFP
ncbi:putative prophage LambdaSo [Rhodovulum sulfidophilum]|uniref:Putative prophage LambdaSo n=3 Tax=Rhodovulum sulfidophilum TaxID=35806 RepID=A0A0D6AYU0_RHOSU|nr:putative prophage LambdaSo [Rhodovulum sulfidophilum]